MYECVTPLRFKHRHRVCLLMLERKRSWNLVETLETHREERQMEENSLHNQHNIVNFLLERAKLTDFLPKVTAADVTRANDVLDVNAFEIRGIEESQRGLFPLTAMMNSSCTPNTQNSIDSDWVCRVISKGEEITDTYVSTMAN